MPISKARPRTGTRAVYHEDVVRRSDACVSRLKADSSAAAVASLHENGIVLRAWNDEAELELPDDAEVGEALERKLKKGEFGVCFYPSGLREILNDEDLDVQDRAFQVGDVCKRSHQSVFSGVILDVSMTLRLAHVISGKTIERDVPASAVQNSARLVAGDHVIYHDWVGVVEEVFEEALVSVGPNADLARICDVGAGLTVGEVPPPEMQRLTGHTSFWQSILSAAPRTPSNTAPEDCAVVDVRQTVCCVNWLGLNQKLSIDDQDQRPRPQRYFSHDINLLTLVRSFSDNSHAVGDKVIFRTPELAAEYGLVPTYHGMTRQPVKVMNVLNSSTEVKVLWQDASQTTEKATDLIPYLNVDEYDVWPGDFVLWKGEGDGNTNTRVAVIQSMDPRERTAEVLWYGTKDKEVVPVLELDVHGSDPVTFGVHRGDVVFISSTPMGHNLPSLGRIGESEDLPDNEELRSLMGSIGMAFSQTFSAEVPLVLPRQASTADGADEIDWYGAVMDLHPEDGTVEIKLPSGRRVRETIDKLTLLVDGWDDAYGSGWDAEGASDMTDEEGSSDMSADAWVGEDGVAVVEKDDWEDVLEDEEMEDAWGGDDLSQNPSTVEISLDDNIKGTPNIAKKTQDTTSSNDIKTPSLTNGHDLSTEAVTDKVVDDLSAAQARTGRARSLMPLDDARWSRFEILEEAPTDHAFLGLALGTPPKAFFSRLQKEFRVLRESLPESILVRSYEDRSDLLRVLIIGSEGTPYEDAPFVIDFALKASYPHEPPLAFFHSWTNGNGRISPNLYEEGKVCLSILNTWTGERSESWNPHKSSLLQIFVSVQALVLVREPWFTEPAYERLKGTDEGKLNSALYTEKAYVLARGFVKRALEQPPLGLENELAYFYHGDVSEDSSVKHTGRLDRILQRAEQLIQDSAKAKREEDAQDESSEADSSGGAADIFVDAADGSTALEGTNDSSSSKEQQQQGQDESPAVSRLSGGGTIVLRRTLEALRKISELGRKLEVQGVN